MAVDYEKSPNCRILEQALLKFTYIFRHVRTREEAPGEMVWYRACNFTYRPGLNCCPKQTPPKPKLTQVGSGKRRYVTTTLRYVDLLELLSLIINIKLAVASSYEPLEMLLLVIPLPIHLAPR